MFELFGQMCPSSLLSDYKTYLFDHLTKMNKIDKVWEEKQTWRRAYVPKSLSVSFLYVSSSKKSYYLLLQVICCLDPYSPICNHTTAATGNGDI